MDWLRWPSSERAFLESPKKATTYHLTCKMKQTTSVIFDWSGTLSDSFENFYEVAMLMFQELGKPPISREEVRDTFDLPYMKFWNLHFKRLDKEKQDALFKKYSQTVDPPHLYPSAKSLVYSLFEKDVVMFVLSSDYYSSLYDEINRAGFTDKISMVFGEVYDKSVVIANLIKEFQLNKHKTIMVGDTAEDISAGLINEIITVGVTYGFQNKEKLISANPHYYIDDLKDLESIVDGILTNHHV